jgi:hypothetical protein
MNKIRESVQASDKEILCALHDFGAMKMENGTCAFSNLDTCFDHFTSIYINAHMYGIRIYIKLILVID